MLRTNYRQPPRKWRTRLTASCGSVGEGTGLAPIESEVAEITIAAKGKRIMSSGTVVICTALDIEYAAVREHLDSPLTEHEERGTLPARPRRS